MAVTPNKGYSLQSVGSNSGTWGDGSPASLNQGVITPCDLNIGGTVTISLSNSNYTLSTTESQNGIVRCTGTLTVNIVVTTANIGSFFVENATTGAYTVTFTNGSGSNVVAPQNSRIVVISDATNGLRLGNDAAGPVMGASGTNHSVGLVGDPGATAGSTRFWCENAAFAVPPFQWFPSGRLTLAAGIPVLAFDVASATSIYYTQYVGATVPIWDGAKLVPQSFSSDLVLTLSSSSHAINNLYDVYIFLDPGDNTTVRIGSGLAWTTTRGTGPGTAQLSRVGGINTNAYAFTALNGVTSYSVGANKATYVGTFYVDPVAGQVSCTGLSTAGQTRRWGVWNAYNRVPIAIKGVDGTASWSYSTGAWRPSNNNTSNTISVLCGLAEEITTLEMRQSTSCSGNGAIGRVGLGVNSTSTPSGFGATPTFLNQSQAITIVQAYYNLPPFLGVSTITALEYGSGAGNWTYYGTEANYLFTARWLG